MKKVLFVSEILVLVAMQMSAQQRENEDIVFEGPFIENFTGESSDFFSFNYRKSGYDYRYYPGIDSFTESGTDVMMYRIDPEDPAGAGRGPEIISKKYTYYGSYSARIRIPDVRDVQPDAGVVVGYFTYNVDREFGQSEIDMEWLIADPEIIYVGTWTGVRPAHNRVGRTINLATGEIYETGYRSETVGPDGLKKTPFSGEFSGKQSMPKKIRPIPGFDASKRFYVYGWDWYPDRLTWWIINPDTNEKIILWDYVGKTVFPDQPSKSGIPNVRTRYRLNFWHTDNWPVETNPKSVERPEYPYELEIDWMAYRPFEDLNPYLENYD